MLLGLSLGCGDPALPGGGPPDSGQAPDGGGEPPDSGVGPGDPDSGEVDGGPHDAGTLDAGPRDGGANDAGRTDAGQPDGGKSDAGGADAGRTDAGRADGGSSSVCTGRCIMVPTPAMDSTWGVDNTGATESSLRMMQFLSHVVATLQPTAASPVTVRLQPGSVYWFGFAIQFRYSAPSNGSAVWNTQLFPTTVLPPFDASYVTFDLNGSTVDQCYSATKSQTDYANCVAMWNVGRVGAGNAIFSISGATDVTIEGNPNATDETQYGRATNSAFANYVLSTGVSFWVQKVENLAYFNWPGLSVDHVNPAVAGRNLVQNIRLTHVDVEWVGGDFVYLRGETAKYLVDPTNTMNLDHITIENNKLFHSGRQGITINGGSYVTITGNHMSDANRHMFDSEPSPNEGWEHLTIEKNITGAGSLGFLSFNLVSAAATDLVIRDNVLAKVGTASPGANFGIAIGHQLPASGVVSAHNVTITGNTQDQAGVYGPAVTRCFTSATTFLISIGNFDGVTVQNNTNYVKDPAQAVRVLGPGAATAVTSPNSFLTGPGC